MAAACPRCGASIGLYENGYAHGWRAVGDDLIARGRFEHLDDFEPDGTYGCGECEWEGTKGDLLA